MPVLETLRLSLRPFREEDIDRLAELMANRDFMRFSLGPYTREQTQGVLAKFLSWEKAGLPSPFAVVLRENSEVLGYCGFLHHPENIPSRRVAEKNGMTVEKEITFRGFPTLVFAITREEWLAKPAAG